MSWTDIVKNALLTFILTLGVSVLSFGFINTLKPKEEQEVVAECHEIKSFSLYSNSSSSTFGSFSLGCGYVVSTSGSKLEYYFYKKGQVGYVLCSIDAKRVEIVETDDKPPCIEGSFYDNGGLKWNETYIIYVPVGTIYEEYKVQL